MATINVSDLTTVALNGSGVFDKLMQATQLYLNDEFKRGRIKGSDYSKVYLGAISANIQQSLAFLLGKQQADKQAELLAAQILKETVDTANATKQGLLLDAQLAELAVQTTILSKKSIQLDTEMLITAQKLIQETSAAINEGKQGVKLDAETASILKNTELGTQQILKLVQETALTTSQVAKVNSEKALIDKQVIKLAEDTLLTTAQVAKVNQDTSNAAAEALKIASEKSLLDKQVVKLTNDIVHTTADTARINKDILKTTSEIAAIDQGTLNAIVTHDIAVETKLKTTAETALLTQKTNTEKSQILDTVNTVPVTGLIGKRKLVLAKQVEGYQRDAEQKITKLVADVFNVMRSTDSTTAPPLSLNQMNSIMKEAVTNSGLTPPAATGSTTIV